MNITENTSVGEVVSQENILTVGGFSLTVDPRRFPNYQGTISLEESDAKSLAKLQYCGLDIDNLQKAADDLKLIPIRTTGDLIRILGHEVTPMHANQKPWFTEEHVTALAFSFPDVTRPGEVLPYSRIVRVRYPKPLEVTVIDKVKNKSVKQVRKYDQPIHVPGQQRSSSEVYYRPTFQMHQMVFDATRTLYITESELKAISISLLGYTAIGFSGANMWGTAKGKKHELHQSLNPHGPLKNRAIPIAGRDIVIVFDNDASGNANVRSSASNLAKALLTVGAKSVKIAQLPQIIREYGGTGVDDFLFSHLGPRWSRHSDIISKGKELFDEIVNAADVIHSISRYKAYSVVRTADRMLTRMSQSSQFGYYELNELGDEMGFRMYDGNAYNCYSVSLTSGGTNGKVMVPDITLQNMARQAYEEGVQVEIIEKGDDAAIPEMEADFPNKVWAEIRRNVPRHMEPKLIGEIEGANMDDKLIRMKSSIINLSTFFRSRGDWASRKDGWLMPPNYRFLSSNNFQFDLPIDDAEPQCPLFMEMITNGLGGDQESIDMLQKHLGKIICFPHFKNIQRFLCLYGIGGSGKSTVVDVIKTIVGLRNVIAFTSAESSRFNNGTLPGKRVAIFSEAGEDRSDQKFDSAHAQNIKSITSGDPVVCEAKGKDPITYCPNIDVITVSNPPPVIPMDKTAFVRRAVFIRWENPIKTVDKDKHLAIVTKEIVGIFWWILQGAWKLHAEGDESLHTPQNSWQDLEDCCSSVDPETTFVSTMLKKSIGEGDLTYKQILDHYSRWASICKIPEKDVTTKKIGFLIQRIHGVKNTPVKQGDVSVRVFRGMILVDPSLKNTARLHPTTSFY